MDYKKIKNKNGKEPCVLLLGILYVFLTTICSKPPRQLQHFDFVKEFPATDQSLLLSYPLHADWSFICLPVVVSRQSVVGEPDRSAVYACYVQSLDDYPMLKNKSPHIQ